MRGEALITMAAILWSTLGIVGKIAYRYGATPDQLMLYRLGLMLPLTIYTIRRYGVKLELVFFGAFVVAPFYLSYFFAIELVGASTAALILYTAPAYVAILSIVLLGEAITWRTVIALILAISGAALVSYSSIELNSLGIAIAVISSILYALYISIARMLAKKGASSEELAFVPILGALPIVFIATAVLSHKLLLDNTVQLATSLYLAYVPTALAYYLYSRGIRHVEACRASILSMLEPVSASVLAWVFLGESFTSSKIFGAIMIILSAIIVSTSTQRG